MSESFSLIKFVFRVTLKLFLDKTAGLNYYSIKSLRAALKKSQSKAIDLSFIALSNKEICGARITYAPGSWLESLKMYVNPDKWAYNSDNVAYFKSLFVDSRFQRQGIGPRLSNLSIENLKKSAQRQ